uniref:RdRp catalytic domain-containing protein n=1 Tax=Strongyloides papillosus TaxID=174720 RepID=A0A0N5BLU8_STREA
MNTLITFITISSIFLTLFYVNGEDSVTVVPKPNYDEDVSKKLVESLRNAKLENKFDSKFDEMLNSIISQIEGNTNLDESISFISHSIVNSSFSDEEKGTFFQELVNAATHITEDK